MKKIIDFFFQDRIGKRFWSLLLTHLKNEIFEPPSLKMSCNAENQNSGASAKSFGGPGEKP